MKSYKPFTHSLRDKYIDCLINALDVGLVKRHSECPSVGFCSGKVITSQDCSIAMIDMVCFDCRFFYNNIDQYFPSIRLSDSYIPKIDCSENLPGIHTRVEKTVNITAKTT